MAIFRTSDEAAKEGMDFTPTHKPQPTQHPPGTNEKVAELIRRYDSGQDLWHAEDKDDFSEADEMPLRQKSSQRRDIIKPHATEYYDIQRTWDDYLIAKQRTL